MQNLPKELYFEIFSYVGLKDIFNFRIFNTDNLFLEYFDDYYIQLLQEHVNENTCIRKFLYMLIIAYKLKHDKNAYEDIVNRLFFESDMGEKITYKYCLTYNAICDKVIHCNRQCSCVSALANSLYYNLYV